MPWHKYLLKEATRSGLGALKVTWKATICKFFAFKRSQVLQTERTLESGTLRSDNSDVHENVAEK